MSHDFTISIAVASWRGLSRFAQALRGQLPRSAALLALALILVRPVAAGPEIPGAPQERPIALVGATIHCISSPAIEQGVVLFDQGKLVAVGADVVIPPEAERIDVTGQHIYPGLFNGYSQLGLVESPALRATVDTSETGQINPNVRAQVAFNPDSELIPVTRSGGVLIALSAPKDSLMAGTSAVMQLDGWTWEEMTLLGTAAMHVEWPQMMPSYNWRQRQSSSQQLLTRDKSLANLRKTMADARAYWQAKQAAAAGTAAMPPHDLRWESLIPVLERRVPVVVMADEIQQIQAAVAWAADENVRLILLGGYDAVDCAALLKQYDIPVIVHGVHRLPLRRHEPYDAAFALPARLQAAGIRFAIASNERDSNMRNLPHHAATAVAHGLTSEAALRAITLSPAEIFGVADRVGSLEVGKDATLYVSSGSTLEVASQVRLAFVQGRKVDLSDRQKKLYEKYQEKYRRIE